MSTEENDPLLDKLRTLPVQTLKSHRTEETLRLAEEALPNKVRPRGKRWPELAMSVALSIAGAMYTVDSVHKLGDIFVTNQPTAANSER